MAKNGDLKELIALRDKLEQYQKVDVNNLCKQCALELAQMLKTMAVKKTPTRKTLRETVNVMDEDGNPVTYKRNSKNHKKGDLKTKSMVVQQGGTLKKGWTILPIVDKGDSIEIQVVNTVDYAPYVEFGHRQTPGRYVPALGKRLKKPWVTGKFMLTKSEIELEKDMPGILEKRLYEKLGELFDK